MLKYFISECTLVQHCFITKHTYCAYKYTYALKMWPITKWLQFTFYLILIDSRRSVNWPSIEVPTEKRKREKEKNDRKLEIAIKIYKTSFLLNICSSYNLLSRSPPHFVSQFFPRSSNAPLRFQFVYDECIGSTQAFPLTQPHESSEFSNGLLQNCCMLQSVRQRAIRWSHHCRVRRWQTR